MTKSKKKKKWKPSADDAVNLATIRWYAITLERLLIEMYCTNRKKWPELQQRLNDDLKELYDDFKRPSARPDLADDDECPPGQVLCRDGLCAAQCEVFE
jgi:hypothetical protein